MTSSRGWSDAAADRGLHLGDGLFETVVVAGGRPLDLELHLERMRRSGRVLDVAVPAALEAFVAEAVPALWTREGRPARAALRISVTRGPWDGLDPPPASAPGVYLAVRALPDAAPAPAAAIVLDRPRIDPSDPLAGHKTLSWMGHVEARRRARGAGADLALLRTLDGDVAEADAGNLFVVAGGVLLTPPLDRGVLPGIRRAQVLDRWRRAGRRAQERRIGDADLAAGDEVLVTSSLGGVRPVHRVGDRTYDAPGPAAVWLGSC